MAELNLNLRFHEQGAPQGSAPRRTGRGLRASPRPPKRRPRLAWRRQGAQRRAPAPRGWAKCPASSCAHRRAPRSRLAGVRRAPASATRQRGGEWLSLADAGGGRRGRRWPGRECGCARAGPRLPQAGVREGAAGRGA